MVLTEEQKTDAYPPASMETAQATTENLYYSNVDATRTAKPGSYPTDTYTNPNDYVAKTTGSGNKIGPAVILKVMAGDKFNLRCNSWWNSGSTPGTPVSPLNDLISALSNGVAGVSGGKATATELTSSGVSSTAATGFLNSQTYNGSKPKAFLNWIFLDEQFKYYGGGFEQVDASGVFKTHLFNNVSIDKCGYLYVYVSNETPNIDVYFDNLQVTHIRGPLLETNEFYPFGLQMRNLSYRSMNFGKPENKKKMFQGQEYNDNLDVDVYEFKYRTDDPQIGRFWQVDPLANDYVYNSPYAFSENKVTTHVELEGLEAVYANPRDAILDWGQQITVAAGNFIDRVKGWFSSKAEVESPSTGGSSVVSTTEVKTSVSTNFGGWLQGIKYGGPDAARNIPLFKTETSTDTKVQVKTTATAGNVKVTAKTDGTTTEIKTEATGKVRGVPVIGSVATTSNSQTGETKTKTTLGAGSSNTQAQGSVEVVKQNKTTTVNVGAGVELKRGNVKTSTSIGISFSF